MLKEKIGQKMATKSCCRSVKVWAEIESELIKIWGNESLRFFFPFLEITESGNSSFCELNEW